MYSFETFDASYFNKESAPIAAHCKTIFWHEANCHTTAIVKTLSFTTSIAPKLVIKIDFLENRYSDTEMNAQKSLRSLPALQQLGAQAGSFVIENMKALNYHENYYDDQIFFVLSWDNINDRNCARLVSRNTRLVFVFFLVFIVKFTVLFKIAMSFGIVMLIAVILSV